MLQYKMVKVPNSRSGLEIATVETPEYDEATYTRTPEWMIRMDKILNSQITVDDGESSRNYCELFGWHAETGRTTVGARSSQRFTSAAVRHSNVSIIVPAGSFFPILETYQNLGKVIKQVRILRLAHMLETKKRMQQVTFGLCYIQSIKQQLDRLIIDLEVAERENKIFLYNEDGTAKGQTVSQFDYISNTHKGGDLLGLLG